MRVHGVPGYGTGVGLGAPYALSRRHTNFRLRGEPCLVGMAYAKPPGPSTEWASVTNVRTSIVFKWVVLAGIDPVSIGNTWKNRKTLGSNSQTSKIGNIR